MKKLTHEEKIYLDGILDGIVECLNIGTGIKDQNKLIELAQNHFPSEYAKEIKNIVKKGLREPIN